MNEDIISEMELTQWKEQEMEEEDQERPQIGKTANKSLPFHAVSGVELGKELCQR